MTTATTQDDTASFPIVVRSRARFAGPPPYPKASALRRTPGVLVDVVLHLLAGLIAGASAGDVAWFFPALVAGYVVASFAHRVLLQRWWGATFGRVVSGLSFVEPGTGRTPTLWRLTQAWLIGLVATVLTALTGG
jgi:hypothetical protein